MSVAAAGGVAAVFPLLRSRAFAAPFDYEVPADLDAAAVPGALVAVPLGPQTVLGVVLERRAGSAHDGRLLPLADVLDLPPVPADLLALAQRLADYYLAPFAACLALVTPPTAALRVERTWALTAEGAAALAAGEERLAALDGARAAASRREGERYRRKGWLRLAYRVRVVGGGRAPRLLRRGAATPPRLGPRQRAALAALEGRGPVPEDELRALSGLGAAGLRRLLEAGAVEVAAATPAAPGGRRATPVPAAPAPDLLDEQRRALDTILREARPGEAVLLHGVTGSGKTEVYLRAAEAVLAAGRGVLFLVPEIALTGQTVARVRERFGGQPVAVLHSGLAAGERLAAYRSVARGETRLVVGARSAVFAPLPDLGLIVIDEEHDTSYKQQSEPAYDARTVARWRAAACGARLVLGSATPSVESVATAPRRAVLGRRVDGSLPPRLEVVDMRDHHGVFSPALAEALTAAADAGEKTILFLNRRGLASTVSCRHCGHAWECPRCDVTLALFGDQRLRCRVCGYHEPLPSACPACGSVDLSRQGVGTERLEREVRRLLPGVELLRLDSDVARSYARLRRVLERFGGPGAKVLVGTQMVAKGHHFPEVTLVGVVDADLTLRFPDFRAEERTFAMLVQVAGRSGRGERPGRVIVQTLDPEARAIVLAARGDAEAFYREELARRTELGYPPAGQLVALDLASAEREKTAKAAAFTAGRLREALGERAEVLGPGPVWRERGHAMARLVVKTRESGYTLGVLREFLARYRERYARRGVRLVPDVDPQWS